ncbi:HIT family protein [Candidatus Gracilibacteria bacterium]|nr:HIT family protein [Candidatus Gracilibacteria bacterium]MCF7898804.1 HIT family protein [Candidatus Paceibacterota bacterium]
MSTIFSKIISGEIPAYKIYEDDYVCAFLDINPVHKGHTLVVPKIEVDDFLKLDEIMYDKVMHRVRYVALVIKGRLGCKRVVMLVEGYDIPHAHMHLIPTNSGDDFDKKNIYKATNEELNEMQKLLQS